MFANSLLVSTRRKIYRSTPLYRTFTNNLLPRPNEVKVIKKFQMKVKAPRINYEMIFGTGFGISSYKLTHDCNRENPGKNFMERRRRQEAEVKVAIKARAEAETKEIKNKPKENIRIAPKREQ